MDEAIPETSGTQPVLVKAGERKLIRHLGPIICSRHAQNKDEIFLCSLSNFDAYTVTRLHKAPKPFVFAIKSTDNLSFFENTADYMHIFACNPKDGEKWIEKILLARVRPPRSLVLRMLMSYSRMFCTKNARFCSTPNRQRATQRPPVLAGCRAPPRARLPTPPSGPHNSRSSPSRHSSAHPTATTSSPPVPCFTVHRPVPQQRNNHDLLLYSYFSFFLSRFLHPLFRSYYFLLIHSSTSWSDLNYHSGQERCCIACVRPFCDLYRYRYCRARILDNVVVKQNKSAICTNRWQPKT
jgi:hypothetical protein